MNVRDKLKNFALLSRMKVDDETLEKMFEVLSGGRPAPECPLPTAFEKGLIENGERIKAIKSVRDRLNLSLLEAKNIVFTWSNILAL